MVDFFKQIFTWWHRQTVGTFIYTVFRGKFVGKDEFGNKYYSNSKGKRWVIYKSTIESSRIPPEWHLWIHFLSKNKPSDNLAKFNKTFRHSKLIEKINESDTSILGHTVTTKMIKTINPTLDPQQIL